MIVFLEVPKAEKRGTVGGKSRGNIAYTTCITSIGMHNMADSFVSFKSLKGRVPFSRAHLIRLERDGRFPRRVKLGECRVGWLESEIDAWIESRIAERDGQE